MATKLYVEQPMKQATAETTAATTTAKPSRLAFIGMKGLPADLPGAGGGERETEAKTTRLVARGYDVTVYCRESYTGKAPAPFQAINLVALPALNKPGLEMLSHTLFSTLHALLIKRVDVINYHGMGNALYLPLVKLFGKRSVVYMDGIDWERPKWGKSAQLLLKWGAAAAFRWSDEVYTDNEASQRQFAALFKREPKLITLAAELWESPGTDQLAGLGLEAEKYILFVGMLRPDKGVHLLVEAYRELETTIPLVIVGDNPDDPAYVKRLKANADARVHFVGYQYGDTARQLFANCMLYVQPSVMEGNSPALMSAMACGRCVVVNGIEQNRETIGDAGLAFAPGDAVDLRRMLGELLANPARITELGLKARQRIERVYNWDRVVDTLENLYQNLLANRRAK